VCARLDGSACACGRGRVCVCVSVGMRTVNNGTNQWGMGGAKIL